MTKKLQIKVEDVSHIKYLRHGNATLSDVESSTGISSSYLGKIESGNANPSIGVLKKLAWYYDVEFVIGSDNE